MQKQTKNRAKKVSREKSLKDKENMNLPINKLLNTVDDKGKFKYPIATILRKYFISNPDPVLNDLRLSNALLHEIRWHKKQAIKFRMNYETKDEIQVYDKTGRVMDRDECYLAYISEQQNTHLAISKLRTHLVEKLLSKCDDEFFTLDMYDEFITKTEKIVKELGYELFPIDIKLIEPL